MCFKIENIKTNVCLSNCSLKSAAVIRSIEGTGSVYYDQSMQTLGFLDMSYRFSLFSFSFVTFFKLLI